MRPPIFFLASLAPLLATVLIVPPPALANWHVHGNVVCAAADEQTDVQSVSDGSGGAFIIWLDRRRGLPYVDLYATRLLGDGEFAAGWPVDGAVLSATGGATTFSAVPDGAGGLLVFWLDTSTYQPRMQRVDESGVLAPGFPANGLVLPIVVGGPGGYFVRAGTDYAAGAYVLWNVWTGSREDLRLTRVTGTGAFATGWNASGVTQGSSGERGFEDPLLATDPSGALVAGRYEIEIEPSGFYVPVFLKRTHADGTGGFSASVSDYPFITLVPWAIDSDGAGGGFITWGSSGTPGRRMQRYLADGSAAWPNPSEAPPSNSIPVDGSGGCYLLGYSGSDLLLHRRASDASIPAPWPTSGVVVASTGSYNGYGVARNDPLLYVAWSHGPIVKASAFTSQGALVPGWAPGGTVVANVQGSQQFASLVPMPPHDALVVWLDWRSGNGDVYAKRLEAGVVLDAPPPLGPSALAFVAAPSPNPAHDQVGFTVALPRTLAAILEIVDVAGRVHGRVGVEARAGTQRISFDARSLRPGLYWARLRQDAHEVAQRFAVIR